ncbi:DNA-binding FadR family transcriptional regulator [Tamaricihabitans halophyticus]|uniref:DNA-binding FadR family transcriptional regulator n=1 Tax=Tamaricihabitans halophyticus TaxID=1262583 RepID=A0A4R2R0R7_9PSEU|nr:FCD domain-containing protein [Tamaricihabitans halophyticus]TCP56073.1 DNA-binding FadR family transcriptional regulator [Tamaricihabitans halophyticus]
MQGISGDALDRLGGAIVTGAYSRGQVLRSEELAEWLGVSRTVVREVVRVLESMGMVAARRRVGITVQPSANWDAYNPQLIRWRLAGDGRLDQLRSLAELRGAIEPMAARLAAQRATAEQCGELIGVAMRMVSTAKSRDLTAFLAHDIDFHRTVLAASNNPMFQQLHEVVAEVLSGRTHYHLMPDEPLPDAVRWHTEVAEAISCGEADRAERAMTAIADQALIEMTDLLAGQTG